MSGQMLLRTSFGPAWVVASSRDIDPELRRRAFASQSKDFRFYEVAEQSLHSQFDHRYFVLENEADRSVAIQPFFFVDQDVTAGLPATFRAWLVTPLRRLWPGFLNLRMLTVGCSAAEGHLDSSLPWAVQALHETIEAYVRREKTSIILLKDFPAQYREPLQTFSQDGYRRVPSLPGASLDLDFGSFEEYMQSRLSKVYRKNLRRKFKALRHAAPVTMEVVSDATPWIEELYALHRQTFARSHYQFEKLTREYFCLIGQAMPERSRFFLWRQNGRLIAFSLCLLHDDTLHDLGVGLDYSVALDLHMYFVTWRDVIEWGLKNGVKSYRTGPLNYDPKLHLRLDLTPQDLYARHASRWLNPLFKFALRYLQPVRHDKTLRQFRNAHEL
ncbi:MAG: hypothetical protein QOE70_4088 [Chthoniobacter sp.]|jgi:hypothetical protein|nr:hypothetical protein [Chthoniobacter sp.]